MRPTISLIAGALLVLIAGCDMMQQQKKSKSQAQPEEMAPAASVSADPVSAVRSALPAGWSILEVTANTFPFYRPEGLGTAIKLISSKHQGDKPPYDAILFIMPGDYSDGGDDPTHGQAQTTPPQLICQASNGKVYLWAWGASAWPSIREDLCKALVQ